ncbi:MAG: WG repeat-containing protein [Flavobacteriales bacterium]
MIYPVIRIVVLLMVISTSASAQDWKILPDNRYEEVSPFSEGLACVKVKSANGMYGYCNQKAELVIAAAFTEADMFQNGYARVCMAGSSGSSSDIAIRHGYIDLQGKFYEVPANWGTPRGSIDSDMFLLEKTQSQGQGKASKIYGYGNIQKLKSELEKQNDNAAYMPVNNHATEWYLEATPFQRGISCVATFEGYHYINTSQQRLFNRSYEKATAFVSYGVALVVIDGIPQIIDMNGKSLMTLKIFECQEIGLGYLGSSICAAYMFNESLDGASYLIDLSEMKIIESQLEYSYSDVFEKKLIWKFEEWQVGQFVLNKFRAQLMGTDGKVVKQFPEGFAYRGVGNYLLSDVNGEGFMFYNSYGEVMQMEPVDDAVHAWDNIYWLKENGQWGLMEMD